MTAEQSRKVEAKGRYLVDEKRSMPCQERAATSATRLLHIASFRSAKCWEHDDQHAL